MVPNLVGGQWRAAAELETLPVFNPAPAEIIDRVPLSGAAKVDTAVSAAVQAYTVWSTMPAGWGSTASAELLTPRLLTTADRAG